jgi:tetratricopeptide (TPR) repeat protein/energy-coupling factor transporter ATP-binding protein EcfA2
MAEFTSHEAAAHQPQALPVMLPAKLVGRDTTLAQIYTHLKASKPVMITGAAGIGKTALAATLASAYTELPGGTLWLNVDDTPLEELIIRVGRAYNVLEIAASSSPLAMVGAVANTFSAHKPLLVLDGHHSPKALNEFVTRCAAGLPVLILSKDPVDGPWQTIDLGPLEAKHAVAMLRQGANLKPADGLDDDLDELASILDYTPFALAVAAGTMRVAKKTPADYLTEFEKIPTSAGATPQLLALTVGFRSLNNALQGVILLLGATFGVGASSELLSLMANASQETVEQVMNSLANNELVERIHRYEVPYYRLHEITAAFATTWLRSQGRLEMLQSKSRETVLAFVKKYSLNSPAAHDKLAGAMDLIMAVARWSADQGERDIVNQLVVSLMQAGDFVNERGYVYELLKLREMASSFTKPFPANPVPQRPEDAIPPAPAPVIDDEDDLLDDEEEEFDEEVEPFDDEIEAQGAEDEDQDKLDIRPAAASAVKSLWDTVEPSPPVIPSIMRQIPDAGDDEDELPDDATAVEAPPLPELPTDPLDRLRVLLRQAKQSGDLLKQVDLLKQIGEIEASKGLDTEAISTYSEVLSAYEALNDSTNVLNTLDTLSALMVKTENSSAAVLHATRGIALADQLGEPETRMYLLVTLADARQQLGESAEAVKTYGQALEIARTRSDAQNEALVLYKLGYAQLDDNQPDTAAETWEQALKLFKAQGKRDYEGRVLGGLGTAYGELGRWEEAINFHTSALYIAREVKDRDVEALELSNLGYACVQANQLGQAVTRYRQALHLAYQANNRENIVSNIVDLVRMLVESPRHLEIADLLINDAIPLDPTDRDVLKLKERIGSGKMQAYADGIEMLPVKGTARDYAANAYKMLEG